MAYLIADGLILAVLLLFALVGAHRGFILSLCGLLAVLVAFVGASFAARTLSPMVADALEPKFASAIEEQLNASIQQQVAEEGSAALSPDDVPLDGVLNALREMGFYETLINTVDKAVENGMTSVAASADRRSCGCHRPVRRLPDPLSAGFRPHSHRLEADQPCPGSGGAAARSPLPEQNLRRPVWPGTGLCPSVCGGLAAAILRARTA